MLNKDISSNKSDTADPVSLVRSKQSKTESPTSSQLSRKRTRGSSPGRVFPSSRLHERQQPKPSTRARSPPLSDTAMIRPRNVEKLVYGRYEIDAWYYSPYPSEFGTVIKRLYVCDTCLRYMKDDGQLSDHKVHCRKRKPPGTVVYATDTVKIYEIDGRDHKMYCQNLCLMAKLFLDHKTLYYDVEGFKFYVVTEHEQKTKDIMVGYFSKEKISYDNYNLACIMTLPSHQRKGYGRLLIEWSYEMSRREGIIGSPEKPLSTLGLLGYHSYWSSIILEVLKSLPKSSQITIASLCQETRLKEEDVISTLSRLGLLRYWKQEHIQAAPSPPSNSHSNPAHTLFFDYPVPSPVVIHIEPNMIEHTIETNHIRFTRHLDPNSILL
ncbi:acyl-CoA N-acyltransferase [Absidia repens]|uniref:histone acetyltransferase n=1 Tax=Absidia repens TaxID=90262 RepID=A0A1X2IU67_9FUNG|nr:acyl-CoA N-acyltransferase [Absidia repens]